MSQLHFSSVIVTVMVVVSHHNDDHHTITGKCSQQLSCACNASHSYSRVVLITLAADNSLHLASEYIRPLLHLLYISITQSSYINLAWLFFTL